MELPAPAPLRISRPALTTGIAVAIPIAWSLFAIARTGFRWDYLGFIVVLPVLAFGSRPLHRLFVGLYPIALVGVFYDAMHLVQNVNLTPVHVCDVRALEMRLFGITMNGERATLHDWLQQHASPALDALFAVPYGTYILASIGLGVYLYRRDFRALLRFTWTFFFMNVVGFALHHAYPVAPPWYFHTHGCVVDLGTHASEGPNLARVDAWLGVGYFRGMYGRASDVFGAIPSLHCAYALLIVLEGWRHFGALGRSLALGFFVAMCVAAVYLDHHWVLDVLAGILCCVVVRASVQRTRALRR